VQVLGRVALRELLDLGRVQREVREAVVFEEDGGLVRKTLRGRTSRRTGRSTEVD
jgi:hypothetical protein